MREAAVLGLVLLAAASAVRAENVLENSSFEKYYGEEIAHWKWSGGTAKATCEIDERVSRCGKASLCLKNPSAHAPNVFGTLTQTVIVHPNRRYTLSCYVKTDNGGVAWIGGGRKWEHRFALPAKTNGWQRVVGSFDTLPNETRFTLRINTDSATPGLWIDDVMLEEGPAASAFVYTPPLAPGEARLTVLPFDPGANLVPNSSFEVAENGCSTGWRWDRRNTDATFTIDTEDPHSGRAAIKITNGTAFGAHVYGMLWLVEAVPIKPNTTYTYSAFVRTGATAPGVWIGGGEGWKVRRSLPATRGRWQRISHTFTSGENETEFLLRICSERPTEGVWIDDLSLREGARPVPSALEGAALVDFVDVAPAAPPEVLHKGHAINTRWAPQRWPCDQWSFCENEFEAEGVVTVGDASLPARLEIAISDGDGKPIATKQAGLEAGVRAAVFTLRVELGNHVPETLALSARLIRDDRGTGTPHGLGQSGFRQPRSRAAGARDCSPRAFAWAGRRARKSGLGRGVARDADRAGKFHPVGGV